MNEINENKLWGKLDENSKSYTVRVLNFFHYRRNIIGQYWKREEVLTWELIRALDTLPKNYFLKELLRYIIKNKKELASVAENLIEKPNEVCVIPYPKLNLPGNENNSASDMELSYKNTKLWIEAKTTPIRKEKLREQILTQTNALSKINNGSNFGVIALIPKTQESSTVFLYWSDLIKIFEKALYKMENDYKNDPDLIRGYKTIAEELVNRIQSRFQ